MGYQLIVLSFVLFLVALVGAACLVLLVRVYAALAGTTLQDGWEGVLQDRTCPHDHVAVARRITAEFLREPSLDDSLEPPDPRSAHGSRPDAIASSPFSR